MRILPGLEEREHRPLFRRHVRRERLTRRLDETEARAIALVAPAGYGKTVLAAEWLQGRRAVWYRAPPAAADVASFCQRIADVVEPLVPGVAARVGERLRAGGATDPAALAELLAAELDAWPADAVLVVDNYHQAAESRAVEELMDAFLELSSARLLVTARRPPLWASARRILYGHVLLVGRDELAMTDAEARCVLSGTPGIDVHGAVREAEGWPALVGLAALAASTEMPAASESEARYRYFAEEVLRRESDAVQAFMLAASVPLSINAAVARTVLGHADPEPVLDRLADEGLIQRAGPAYRFHPLLRDFLRGRFLGDAPQQAASVAEAAIEHARAQNELEEAFALAVENHRLDDAARLAAAAAPELLVAGRTETVERWLEVCGPHALAQPSLQLARAAILLRRGEIDDAASLSLEVAQQLDDDDPRAARAWYLAAQSRHLLGDRPAALEYALRSTDAALDAKDLTNALLLSALAAAALEADDGPYLERLEQLARTDIEARFRLAGARTWSSLRRETLAGAWRQLAPVLDLIDQCRGPMLTSEILGGAAYLSVLRAEYEAAEALATRAEGVAADHRLRLPHTYCLLYLAHAHIGLRQFEKARRVLSTVETAGLVGRPGVRILLEIARLKLALARGDDAPPQLGSEDLSAGTSRRSRGVYLALKAVAAAREADGPALAAALAGAREASRGVETRFYCLAAELVRTPEPAGAASLLADVVAADVADAFVVAYRARPELLSAAAADGDARASARRIVARAHDHALGRTAGVLAPLSSRSPEAALTPRERDVFALVEEGLSNAEIARRLFISPNTAKVHLRHILEKLDARTRAEAVRKLRDRA